MKNIKKKFKKGKKNHCLADLVLGFLLSGSFSSGTFFHC